MVFLIGLVCLAAALAAGGRASPPRHPLRWPAAIAALALFAVLLAGDDIARYRFTLLGLRFRVADDAGAPSGRSIRVGGDYDVADLHVRDVGAAVAELRAVGDSVVDAVLAVPAPDARAVLLVEHRRPFGRDRTQVLGAVALAEGDTVRVGGRAGAHALVVGSRPDTIGVLGWGLPLPWVRVHTLRDVAGAASGAQAIASLPGIERAWPTRWLEVRPSVRQRTYPLADVLARIDGAAARAFPALSSFFFYDDHGRLALAVLDPDVEVAGRSAAPVAVWSRETGGRRVTVAHLPLRDYPEPKLVLPERYGVRPAFTVRFTYAGGWLDAALAAPEIRTLDRAALERLDLPGARLGSGRPAYRIRLSPGRNVLARTAVVFGTPARTFAAAGQAVFDLPTRPSEREFRLVTPSGLARWEVGRPLTLGDDERAILLRVDGQSSSGAFWAVHLLVFGLALVGFRLGRGSGRIYALALAAFGILSVRLLLGLSAHLEYPYVQEAQKLGLWLLPFGPWAIGAAGRIGAVRRRPPVLADWVPHAAFALALVTLASIVFVDSPAKRLAFSTLALLVAAALALPPAGFTWLAAAARRAGRAGGTLIRRIRPVSGTDDALANGWLLGLVLLGLRILLDLLGAREQFVIGGTRIGLSVFYTPLSLVAAAVLLHRRALRISGSRTAAGARREVAAGLVHFGFFILFAFVAVALWISDFGIVFTTLPGLLLLLALSGARWAPRSGYGRALVLATSAPLILFMLVPFAPSLLHPTLRGGLELAEARMAEWNRNELLLLERGDPQALKLIGQRRSEALAVMRETMRSYTRGNWGGRDFLEGRVTPEIAVTAPREHAVSALLAAQWGVWGVVGLVLLLLSVLVPIGGALARPDKGPGRARWLAATLIPAGLALLAFATLLPPPFNFATIWCLFLLIQLPAVGPAIGLPLRWGDEPGTTGSVPRLAALVATLFALTFAFAGIYMVLANYGLVLFTGKNVYLLGLDSASDAIEGLTLLGGAAAGLGALYRVPGGSAGGTQTAA